MSGELNTMPRRKTESVSLMAVRDRLRRLGMKTMADALEEIDKSGELSHSGALEVIDQISSIQEIESLNNTSTRYKNQANLFQPTADLMDILHRPDRHINAPLVDQLATNEYIQSSRNIMIISETGCGKTFFACAFGNQACDSQYTVKYYTMVDLLDEFKRADERGKKVKLLNKLANTNLVIIDDFLLTTVTTKDVEVLYRLFASKPRRNKPRSFIICSQLMKEEMYTRLSTVSPSLSDAIMNRLSSKAYILRFEGPSMREIDIAEELRKQREGISANNQ